MSESTGGFRWPTLITLAIGVSVVIAASGCAGSAEPDAPGTSSAAGSTTSVESLTATNGIEYADFAHLDVHAPGGGGPWPVVVVVHGISQSRSEFTPLAEAIASHGAVVFNVSVPTSPPFLETIEYLACAVRFARGTAADHDGDPRTITVVGNSLGAATGAVVAMAGDAFEGPCVVDEGSAVPDALVGYEGPYDYATHDYQVVDLLPLQHDDPAVWQAINPYTHIGGNADLVVRLVHGEDLDDIWYEVPPAVSHEFHQALADAGYDVELTLLDGATHIDLGRGTEAFEATIRQVLETAHGLMLTTGADGSSGPATLTFGGTDCLYDGPAVVAAGEVTLTFVNNSGATGAVNVIELLDGKTWEDLVEYAGEQPSSGHAPQWSRDVRTWRPISSGESLLWEAELTPGTYAVVCANTSPLAVWLGSQFIVER